MHELGKIRELKQVLREIREAAAKVLCDANDLIEYGFSGGYAEEDEQAIRSVRNLLRQILEKANGALED